MIFYLNAAHRPLDADLLQLYRDMTLPQAGISELLTSLGDRLLQLLGAILTDMRSGAVRALHDFYLKLFQFSRQRLAFDVILLDEAQDSSAVMLAILDRQPARKILVGDGFQQIYAFRFAINSLDRVIAPEYALSQSFRFGDELAQHLSLRISEAYALLGLRQQLKMRGGSEVTTFSYKPMIQPAPRAVVSRSNLKLLDACLTHLDKGRVGLHFEGGYGAYAMMNARVFGLLHLADGKHTHVDDPLIRRFRSLEQAEHFARDTQNQSLSQALDLVRRYGRRLFNIDKQIKSALVEKDRAQLVLTTTHRSKGQEYEHVAMTQGDFTSRDEIKRLLKSEKKPVSAARLREEINIYYVAATRARSSVYLSWF